MLRKNKTQVQIEVSAYPTQYWSNHLLIYSVVNMKVVNSEGFWERRQLIRNIKVKYSRC